MSPRFSLNMSESETQNEGQYANIIVRLHNGRRLMNKNNALREQKQYPYSLNSECGKMWHWH